MTNSLSNKNPKLPSAFVPLSSGFAREHQGLSPAELSRLLQAFHTHAIEIEANAKDWQQRALKAWHAVARAWENWQFPGAEAVLAQLENNTHMSPPVLRESLANHFRMISTAEMAAWLEEVEEGRATNAGENGYPAWAFIIGSGNIPGVALQPLIQFSLLGIPALVKSASSEPHFMPAVLTTLAQYDEEVAAHTLALTWPRDQEILTDAVLAQSPAVVAFGDDVTMARLQHKAAASFAPFGDRFSTSIVSAAGAKLQTLRKLAYDFIMFDGKGCLSPQAIFVIADTWEEVENFAMHLAGVLAEENQKWPAGHWSEAERALIQQWRGAWQMRRAAGDKIAILQPSDTAWSVVAADEFDLDDRTAFRAVRLWWVKDFAEVMLVLKNHSHKIHALAADLKDEEFARLALDLDEQKELLGRIICAPGELQRPFFGWMGINRRWFELMHGIGLGVGDGASG